MSNTPDNSKDEFETLFKQSVSGLFNASMCVNLRKQEPNVTLQVAMFGGRFFSYQGNKKGMNILLKPKNTKKLIAFLQEALKLQLAELEKLGYQVGDQLKSD